MFVLIYNIYFYILLLLFEIFNYYYYYYLNFDEMLGSCNFNFAHSLLNKTFTRLFITHWKKITTVCLKKKSIQFKIIHNVCFFIFHSPQSPLFSSFFKAILRLVSLFRTAIVRKLWNYTNIKNFRWKGFLYSLKMKPLMYKVWWYENFTNSFKVHSLRLFSPLFPVPRHVPFWKLYFEL